MDEDHLAAAGDAPGGQFPEQPPHRLAAVDGLERQPGVGAEGLYPLPQGRTEPGIAAVVMIQRDAPAIGDGRRRIELAHLVGDEATPLEHGDGEDLLPCPLARDEPRQGATAGAGQHPEIRREGHLGHQLGDSGDGERAAPPLRHYQGVRCRELGQPVGILAAPVALAVHKNEIHAPAFGRAQGCVADAVSLTAYDAGGAQPGPEAGRRQGVNVIGVGAPKRQQVGLALRPSLLQVVLELAPLVAGEGRVDQIIPLAPEPHAVGIQQRVVDRVQGGGDLSGFQWRIPGGGHLGRQCIVCHKVGG